jgi:hypothetical protein
MATHNRTINIEKNLNSRSTDSLVQFWTEFLRKNVAGTFKLLESQTRIMNSELLMCRKFTLVFATNFVGSIDIRASREVFPIEVRRPEIGKAK